MQSIRCDNIASPWFISSPLLDSSHVLSLASGLGVSAIWHGRKVSEKPLLAVQQGALQVAFPHQKGALRLTFHPRPSGMSGIASAGRVRAVCLQTCGPVTTDTVFILGNEWSQRYEVFVFCDSAKGRHTVPPPLSSPAFPTRSTCRRSKTTPDPATAPTAWTTNYLVLTCLYQ